MPDANDEYLDQLAGWLEASGDEREDDCRAFAINEKGEHKPIDAKGIAVDLPGGRGLLISLRRHPKSDGVQVYSYLRPPARDTHYDRIVIKAGCANSTEITVETIAKEEIEREKE